jgi:hypothetical protein
VPLDQLHLENLHATLAEFGLNAADFDNRDLTDLCASNLDLSSRFADA